MSELLLLGVNHYDPKEPEKIDKALTQFAPGIILLEGSQSRADAQEIFVEEIELLIRARVISQELGEIFLEEQKPKGDAGKAAFEYAARVGNGVEVDYLNDSFEERTPDEIRRLVRKLYLGMANADPEKLRTELDMKWGMIQAFTGILRTLVNTPLEPQIARFLPNHKKNVGDRDAIMETSTRARLGIDKICTVTGMAHIIRNPRQNSLYCRVRDLKPGREFL